MNESCGCGKRESCKGCERLASCGMNCLDACPVLDTVSREVLFIKKNREEICPFELHFGSSVACTCPVRRARYFS